MTSTPYETDYNQWIQETVQNLRERNFNNIDWENLIEEIESMGKNDKRALISLLTRLLEHLLKLAYWESEKPRSGNHWASEIVNFRSQIQTRLEDSPSLKPQLITMYEKAYPVAIKSVSKLFTLPPEAEITLSQALDEDWFPKS
jgi:enoyl reductase-like protein